MAKKILMDELTKISRIVKSKNGHDGGFTGNN